MSDRGADEAARPMARVIRGGQARVIRASVTEARDEAARILEEAREEAARIHAAQHAELRERAREEARAELATAHLALERERRAVLDETESSIATLALAVARRIVGDALEADPEHLRVLVDDALGRMRRASRIRVRVHPDDAAALHPPLPAEVLCDPTLTRGGCVVESELGEVDARLEVRLDALAQAIAKSTS